MHTAPASGSPRHAVQQLDALTAMRFPAAMLVVAYHYQSFVPHTGLLISPIVSAYGAVTFFFMLSGFVLAHNYVDRDLSDPATRRTFYLARLARIAPVYAVSIIAAVPFFVAAASRTETSSLSVPVTTALTLLGVQAWIPGAACAINCPAWAVSAELSFYVIFPFVLAPLVRHARWSTLALLVFWLVSVGVASVVWEVRAPNVPLLDPGPAGPQAALLAQSIKFNPLLRLPEFVAGVLLFCFWRRFACPNALLIASSLVAVSALFALSEWMPQVAMSNGLTALFLAPLILSAASVRSRFTSARMLVQLGALSYPLYLLHMPAAALVRTMDRQLLDGALTAYPWSALVLSYGLALFASAVAHHLIEQPARRAILRLTGSAGHRPAS